jgi:hypothetical protein
MRKLSEKMRKCSEKIKNEVRKYAEVTPHQFLKSSVKFLKKIKDPSFHQEL